MYTQISQNYQAHANKATIVKEIFQKKIKGELASFDEKLKQKQIENKIESQISNLTPSEYFRILKECKRLSLHRQRRGCEKDCYWHQEARDGQAGYELLFVWGGYISDFHPRLETQNSERIDRIREQNNSRELRCEKSDTCGMGRVCREEVLYY